MSDHLSDPELNCILAVCCDPEPATARLSKRLLKDGVCEDAAHADRCAAWVQATFDLAPKGSLVQLKADIARLARG